MTLFKDKTVRGMLFGKHAKIDEKFDSRVSTWNFPAIDDSDTDREIKYPQEDGFILYLLKRIEKLEKQVAELLKTKKG